MKKVLSLALFIQFFSTTIASWVIFRLFQGNSIWPVLMIGIIGTILMTLLGDLWIFPRHGILFTAIADGIISSLVALFISIIIGDFVIRLSSILLFGLLILIFEYFFHKYLVD